MGGKQTRWPEIRQPDQNIWAYRETLLHDIEALGNYTWPPLALGSNLNAKGKLIPWTTFQIVLPNRHYGKRDSSIELIRRPPSQHENHIHRSTNTDDTKLNLRHRQVFICVKLPDLWANRIWKTAFLAWIRYHTITSIQSSTLNEIAPKYLHHLSKRQRHKAPTPKQYVLSKKFGSRSRILLQNDWQIRLLQPVVRL